jgi:hypothetical protein
MQLLFISILVCQAPSAPSLILVSLHSFFFLSFFLPESEEIAGSACSEGCRRRDDGLMQQQTLEMMTQIGSFKNFCNMFGFLKSFSHKMSFLPLFCATIGKGNNRVKPTIAGCLSGGWWHWWHRSRIAKLGPDPLRQDADKEVVWLSMQANPIP